MNDIMRKQTYFIVIGLFLAVHICTFGTNKSVGITNPPVGYISYSSITSALIASNYGDTILVAVGTYTESELSVPQGVVLIGGFPILSKDISDRIYSGSASNSYTILDGNAQHRVATVYGVLDGFIIRNGHTTTKGGGVLIDGGTVQNTIIRGNVALNVINPGDNPARGGGAYLQNNARLINCIVAFNMANNGFGVAGSGDLINNTITSNTIAPYAIRVESGGFYPGTLNNTGTFTTMSQFFIAQTETTVAQYAVFCAAISMAQDPMVRFTSTQALLYNFSADNYLAFSTYPSIGLTYIDDIWIPVAGKENHPMVYPTWYGALAYCLWLGGTLPTEAQWEYAARKTISGYSNFTYAGSNNINTVAWYTTNSGGTSKVVATKAGNEIGLYDMSGNVSEWCCDWYDGTYPYSNNNPVGPISGQFRILREGAFSSSSYRCSVVSRSGNSPLSRGQSWGFRIKW